jgi:hypothetical protein
MRSRLALSALAMTVLWLGGVLSAGQQQASGLPTTREQAQALAKADTGVGSYFTDAQAARGGALYNRNCGYCHFVDPSRRVTMSGINGGALAPRWLQKSAEGIARYPSVYYAFRRLDYMPVNDTASVTPQQKADILAFLLQQNGLSSGTTELIPDDNAMRAMPLPSEPGFVHLFNGHDLSGWKFLLGYHCTSAPEGCGKTDPGDVFYVKNGLLSTTGRIHGFMYTAASYDNFTFRVEQRIPIEWDDDDELVQDQTGLLFFMGGNVRPWPDKFIEVEGRYYDLMGVASVGMKSKLMFDVEARRRAIKRVTEWQRIEVVSKDGVMKNYLNGVLVSTVEPAEKLPAGPIGLQSQGGPVEWRNIRVRVEGQ